MTRLIDSDNPGSFKKFLEKEEEHLKRAEIERKNRIKRNMHSDNLTFEQKKQKWIEALRSGKYQQTTGMLHEIGAGFCCLGVACEVAIENGVAVKKNVNHGASYDDKLGGLPDVVRSWFGITNEFGTYEGLVYDKASLVCDNDQGKNFQTIADIIESHPKGLFTWQRNPKNFNSKSP